MLLRGLRMRYGTVEVLDGVDFTAHCGEVLVLLGRNGAGKTTTIEILEGFRVRSAGEVSVLGADPAKADENWRAGVGIVLQSWRDHRWPAGASTTWCIGSPIWRTPRSCSLPMTSTRLRSSPTGS